MPSLEANQLLRAAADACDSRKAEDILILALDPSESSLTDYFLICSGTNERQNVAISDEIEFRLKQEFGVYPNSIEGRRQGEWVLMDYVDFVVHIFMPEKRAYYGLERLRKSAKNLSLEDLNGEITAALKATRAKRPVSKKATETAAPGGSQRMSGPVSGKQPSPAAEAAEGIKPVKAVAKKASAAKKAAKSTETAKPTKKATAKKAASKTSAKTAAKKKA